MKSTGDSVTMSIARQNGSVAKLSQLELIYGRRQCCLLH